MEKEPTHTPIVGLGQGRQAICQRGDRTSADAETSPLAPAGSLRPKFGRCAFSGEPRMMEYRSSRIEQSILFKQLTFHRLLTKAKYGLRFKLGISVPSRYYLVALERRMMVFRCPVSSDLGSIFSVKVDDLA
jgi:hypothetical protein